MSSSILTVGMGELSLKQQKNAVRVVVIDIDQQRIVESKANAIAAKVNDQPTFLKTSSSLTLENYQRSPPFPFPR